MSRTAAAINKLVQLAEASKNGSANPVRGKLAPAGPAARGPTAAPLYQPFPVAALLYQPFPVAALPPPLGSLVAHGADALGCDPAFIALPALAVCAGLIGNARAIRLRRTWEEPCIVWAAVVADSGTLKTPAFKLAVGPVHRLQQPLIEAHRRDVEQYRKALRRGDADDTPPPPVRRRLLVNNVTVECLAPLLEDNPKGLVAARDELSGWLRSFNQYRSGGRGDDLANWLEMHSAGTVLIDRKTGDRPTVSIPRAAVSVCGGIQPAVLQAAMSPEAVEAGLQARLLMAMPPRRVKAWTETEVAPEVLTAYEECLGRLADLLPDHDAEDRPRPAVLTLDADAKAAWVSFYNAWAALQADADPGEAAVLSKLEGYAARLALLHHVVGLAGEGERDQVLVGVESIEAGVTLVRWFAHEAERIRASAGEDSEGRADRHMVERIAARGGRVTVRELQKSNNRKYRTRDDAEKDLQRLVQAGLGTWEVGRARPTGGHRERVFVLCTTHDTSDTCPATGGGDS
jgi:hypothetical protein